MTLQQRVFRIALAHAVISLLLLYVLVVLEMPNRPSTLVSTICTSIWAVLNPPVYAAREIMRWLTGAPLAFYAVFFLQICMSASLYFGIVWLHDIHAQSSNKTTSELSE